MQLIERASTMTVTTYAHVSRGLGTGITHGVPSSVTVRIATPAVVIPAEGDGVAATVDSVSATVATGAAAGDTSLTVGSSTAWVRRRRYLVQTPGGARFVVVCRKTATGTTLTLSRPLPMAVASSSTISGIAITKALTSAQTDIVGPGVARFSATVDGDVATWDEPFRIVRRVPQWPLDSDELVRRLPWVATKRETDDDDYTDTIEAALDNVLLPALRAKTIAEEGIVTSWPLVPAHVAAVRLHLVENDTSATTEDRAFAREAFVMALDAALADVQGWYETDQAQDPVTPPAQPADWSGIRLRR